MVRHALLLATALLLALPAQAGTARSLEQAINAFKQSGDHNYAPLTTSRADAYLGAAMLAESEQRAEEAAAALKKAEETLAEAKVTAAGFREQFAALLTLRADAHEVMEIVTAKPEEAQRLSIELMNEADAALNQAVLTREKGELNRTIEHASKAESGYRHVLNNDLPDLSVITARLISKAATCGAKRYAPVTHKAAHEKLAAMRGYIDGLDANLPTRPTEAYQLAIEATTICEQVKKWRKDSGSFEEIMIRERKFRQSLANNLEVETAANPLLVSNSTKELVAAAASMRNQRDSERKGRSEDAKRLQAKFEAELQAKLAAQTDELLKAQRSKLTDMKEVFRAKLERETFEKKRQTQLKRQFQPGDADILVNLDGSLLIRMVGLQFASGGSKIDQKYFDMLARLRAALELYADRTVRIEGHTDDQGDVKPNQQLSLKRAEAVRDFLIAAGTDGGRLKALGYGEVRPIASNEFAQGRAMNRRIDIVIDAAK